MLLDSVYSATETAKRALINVELLPNPTIEDEEAPLGLEGDFAMLL